LYKNITTEDKIAGTLWSSTNSTAVLGSGMIQDGINVNLGDPLYSSEKITKCIETSQKGQGLMEDQVEVGLIILRKKSIFLKTA